MRTFSLNSDLNKLKETDKKGSQMLREHLRWRKEQLPMPKAGTNLEGSNKSKAD